MLSHLFWTPIYTIQLMRAHHASKHRRQVNILGGGGVLQSLRRCLGAPRFLGSRLNHRRDQSSSSVVCALSTLKTISISSQYILKCPYWWLIEVHFSVVKDYPRGYVIRGKPLSTPKTAQKGKNTTNKTDPRDHKRLQ